MKLSVLFSTVCVLVLASLTSAAAQDASVGSVSEADQSSKKKGIETIDHFVPHFSTVSANAGQLVHLFVREVSPEKLKKETPVVLMITGTTQPAMAAFNLPFENYNWMEFLADAGFDVFAMDLTGYGLSPRPMMDDPCNVSTTEQQNLLIPNPLAATCAPSYPFRLTTRKTDTDEIDTVVNYIQNLRDVEKVSLIGWSLGSTRVGAYAGLHPEKVDRLFLYATAYIAGEPVLPPPQPQPGVPMTLRTVSAFFANWDAQVKCVDQFDPTIRPTLAARIVEFDPLAQTWGTQPLWRSPVQSLWGWDPTAVKQIAAPSLVIVGDLDLTAPPASGHAVYNDMVVAQKVYVHVECAAHQMLWESQHNVLYQASLQWLLDGTFAGQTSGEFAVSTLGVVTPEP